MNVPILPIAHNAGWLWPKGVMGKRPGTVTLSIGKPIAPASMTAAELMQAVETWIEGEVQRLGSPLRDAPRFAMRLDPSQRDRETPAGQVRQHRARRTQRSNTG